MIYPVKVKKFSDTIGIQFPDEKYNPKLSNYSRFLEVLNTDINTPSWFQAKKTYDKAKDAFLKMVKDLSKYDLEQADEMLCTWYELGSESYWRSCYYNFPIFSSLGYLKSLGNIRNKDITKMKEIDNALSKCKSLQDRSSVIDHFREDILDIRTLYTRRFYIDDYIKSEL